MHKAYLLLGSNLADRESMITKATLMINCFIGHIVEQSSVYETEPWGFFTDSRFLNRVLAIETDLSPQQLFIETERIENNLGRIRTKQGYSSRVIDIDILFYDDVILDDDRLKIPHPRIPERLFTLIPLQEIAGSMVHPQSQITIDEMTNHCQDSSGVKVYPTI